MRNEEMGSRLRDWRKARDWSQKDLADAVGRTQATVSRWESGDDIPDTVSRICLLELSGGLFGLRDWDSPPAAAPASAPPPEAA